MSRASSVYSISSSPISPISPKNSIQSYSQYLSLLIDEAPLVDDHLHEKCAVVGFIVGWLKRESLCRFLLPEAWNRVVPHILIHAFFIESFRLQCLLVLAMSTPSNPSSRTKWVGKTLQQSNIVMGNAHFTGMIINAYQCYKCRMSGLPDWAATGFASSIASLSPCCFSKDT